MLALSLFGLVHGLLLWMGDILFIYSVVGTLLVFFRNLAARTLLLIAVGVSSPSPDGTATTHAALVDPHDVRVAAGQLSIRSAFNLHVGC